MVADALDGKIDLIITKSVSRFARNTVDSLVTVRQLKEKGITMILNTHYMEEASQICDRLLILDKGKILKEGNPKQLVLQEVGREVIEVRDHKNKKEILKLLNGLVFTFEEIGDTLYVYCEESKDIMFRLNESSHCSVLRRPAALEDLFLKLTGRGLAE